MFTPKACSMMFGAVIVVLAHGAVAQDYKMTLHTIASGGGSGTGGEVELDCTIGQAVAGKSAGGEFMLLGGYWGGATSIAVPGDCNADGVVRLDDFACFANCFTGPRGRTTVECALLDLDSDGDIDVEDYGILWVQFGN